MQGKIAFYANFAVLYFWKWNLNRFQRISNPSIVHVESLRNAILVTLLNTEIYHQNMEKKTLTIAVHFRTFRALCKKPHFSEWSNFQNTFFWMPPYLVDMRRWREAKCRNDLLDIWYEQKHSSYVSKLRVPPRAEILTFLRSLNVTPCLLMKLIKISCFMVIASDRHIFLWSETFL